MLPDKKARVKVETINQQEVHMRMLKLSVCALLALALIAPVALAEGSKLPQEGSFHVDVRALTLFDYGISNLERDDPADTQTGGLLSGGLGLNGMGVKIGYLINGKHDVGGQLLFGGSDNVTSTEYDAGGDAVDYHTNDTSFRVAGYYNYNFHVNDWVMPYVGPLVGIETTMTTTENPDEEDSKVSTTVLMPFGGVEGGVKLFPFEHVAFDLGALVTGGSVDSTTTFGDDSLEDDEWSGSEINVGAFAGLNIYF